MRIRFELKNNLNILAILKYFYDKGKIQPKRGMPSKLMKSAPVIKIVAADDKMKWVDW